MTGQPERADEVRLLPIEVIFRGGATGEAFRVAARTLLDEMPRHFAGLLLHWEACADRGGVDIASSVEVTLRLPVQTTNQAIASGLTAWLADAPVRLAIRGTEVSVDAASISAELERQSMRYRDQRADSEEQQT